MLYVDIKMTSVVEGFLFETERKINLCDFVGFIVFNRCLSNKRPISIDFESMNL